MKLSEIVADLKSLKETIASFITDKAKATTDALTAFAAKLTTLEAGAVAELTAAQTQVAELTGKLADQMSAAARITADLAGITAALDSALASAKVTPEADATPAEKISALAGAVTAAVARIGVAAGSIPASGGRAAAGREPAAVLKEYQAITDPTERVTFYRANKAAIDAAYRN